jgi:bifunctional DNA-binding transcriptional regulator/antitoxin component of YhaV-PrlF toxin-antitoxin module
VRGQVTIPRKVREETGLLPHTEVEFIVEPHGVRIVKVDRGHRPTRGELAVERLRASMPHFSMTTDEIMALTRGDD